MKKSNTMIPAKSSNLNDQKTIDTPVQSVFEDLYLKKDYKGASNYLLQNKQQLSSGIFHYNLGTVYSKLGDFPAARFHLEKAIKEGYINSASLNNLTFVKAQLQVDDISTSVALPDQMMNVALTIPPAAYLSLTLLLVLLGLVLLKSKRLFKKISIGIFILIALTPMLFSEFYISKINYAIAFKDISLYEGPSKIFSEKGKVHAGSKVILGEYKEGWFYVKFPLSLTGWINKDQIVLY